MNAHEMARDLLKILKEIPEGELDPDTAVLITAFSSKKDLTWKDIAAQASDEQLEKWTRAILVGYPPERDHELSDVPPGSGCLIGNLSAREVVKRARQILRRRDTGPTMLREGK